MKTVRLNKREAKEAFRASRLARSEKQPRSGAKKAIKRAKAALKQSGENVPRGFRDVRALQIVKDPLPTDVARGSKTRAGAREGRRKPGPDAKPRPDAKGARKAKREAGISSGELAADVRSSDKRSSKRPDSGALKIALAGADAKVSVALLEQLVAQAAPRSVAQPSLDETPNIAIHGSDLTGQTPPATDDRPAWRNADLHIYLEPSGASDDAGNSEASGLKVAKTAAEEQGFVVRMRALARRHASEQLVTPNGLSDAGVSLLASTILQIAMDRELLPFSFRQAAIEADDILAARKLAENPLELLSKLAWDSDAPPKVVSARISREAIEAFVEGRLHLPGREEAVLVGDGVDWSLELHDKRQKHSLYGLTFLSPVLAYWYAKANGAQSEETAGIDQYLKEAGFTASTLLARAGAVTADFASSCRSAAAPEAWEKIATVSRAKVQLLFLLCCRSAARRRIRFESELCTRTFSSLWETLEYLRSPGLAPVGSEEGVNHLSFMIGLALPLRRLAYGKNLLEECCDALVGLQLGPGLSEDGIWFRGTFEQHCEMVRTILGLVAATRGVKIPAAANLTSALGKMTSFVESMLRAGMLPPPIDRIALVDQGKLVGSARKLVPPNSADKAVSATQAYPGAGYFVSHSAADHGPKSSQLAIHVSAGSQRLRQLGRIGLGFCMGESELIVGGGVSSRKAPARARAASRTDLATGNEYRVNGASYSVADSSAAGTISIEHHCEGRGWAAAMIACRAHTNALIRRTAIHLKPVHALIVVDELESRDGSELAFEQFWHLSPELRETGGLCFSDSAGHFTAAFNHLEQFPVTIGIGSDENPVGWTLNKAQEPSPNLYLHRTLSLARGIAVSAFQWGESPVPVEVSDASFTESGWSTQVAGRGFKVRFARDGLTVRRLEGER